MCEICVKYSTENNHFYKQKHFYSHHPIFCPLCERVRSFFLISRRLYPSGLLFRCNVYAGRHALFLTVVCFFSKFWLLCNSCIQSSGLKVWLLCYRFSLCAESRCYTNKSSNSLLLNHIANFSYLYLCYRALCLRCRLEIREILLNSFETVDYTQTYTQRAILMIE